MKIIRKVLPFCNLTLLFIVSLLSLLHPSLAESSSSIAPLNHRVIDAEYSKQLDRIITVSATPLNQLHLVDPLTGASVPVDLPLPPACVSVSPDGLFAAVGHNGWISYVNLATPALIKTLPVTTDVLDIVLAGNGWVYAFPRVDQWETIRCVNLQSGVEVQSTGYNIYAGTLAKLHPGGNAMYGANNGLSPSNIEKYDISGGQAGFLYPSPYWGDYAMCGNLWISEDGLRIFTKCGNVFRSSQIMAEDMFYNGSLANIGQIADLSHSASAGKVLAIPAYIDGQAADRDTEVWKYNYTFLTFESKIKFPAFSINGQTYPSHGRFVFFSADGSSYFVIVQADASAGMLLDYGIFTVVPGSGQFVIRPNAGLGGTITPSSEVEVVQGTSMTFSITPDPGYDVADVMVDGVSVGKVTSYAFENVVGNHTIEATFTRLLSSSIFFLNHRVVDAEYSKQLDRIITVSATPLNQLHVVDPLTGASVPVDLPLSPACVSVGPDGLFAAVGHNGWISYVNLATPALIKTLAVTTDVSDIVLAGNGWIYALSRYDDFYVWCINLESGAETIIRGFIIHRAKLHPSGRAIYGAHGASPSDIEKYDITPGPAVYLYDSPYHGDYPMCGDLWISEDGLRIFTKCGNVFRSSEVRAEDMLYNGSLANIGQIADLSHSASAGKVLAIPAYIDGQAADRDTEVWKYNYAFLTFESKIKFPAFSVNGQTYPSHGRFVFFNADGSKYSVIVQADPNSGVLLDYGIFTLGTNTEQFFIQATASTGGTITPSGEVAVYKGSTRNFTFTPSTGYHILNVLVDGSSVGAVTSYEFTNVTAGHTITANFALDVPGISTLISPTGTITNNTPTYIWNTASNSTSYFLWVNDPTGNKIQKWYTAAEAGCASGTGTCSVTPTTQVIGSCWWWIQTRNSANYGPWSTPLSFTVNPLAPPLAPVPVSPSGTTTTTIPTYIWNAVSNATDYYLWVNDSSGSRIQQWYTAAAAGCGAGTGNCSVTPATALNMGVGQWWVQAKNSVGTSPWSAGMSFTIQIPLDAATPLTPIEGSTITTGTPAYTWTAVPAATWYYLSADDPSGNRILQWYTSSAAGCGSGAGNCSVTPSTTLSSGACRWKVQTWNSSSGFGPWSTQVSFTVNVPEPRATLVSPTGTILTATPTYIWNAVSGSTWYLVSVDDTTGNKIRQWYTASAVGCGSGTGDCSVTPSTALAAGAATWKVQTWVNGGPGPWSIPMSFAVSIPVAPGPPVAPNLISPSGTMTATAPAYIWNAVSNATDYYLWVNDSSGIRIQQWYTAAAAGCGAGTGNCSVTPPTALNIGTGQWWVQAKNSLGTSLWSVPLSFTVTLSGATLISPSGTITDTTPTYTWNAVPGSTWYNLKVHDSTGDKILQWYTAAQAGCPSGTGTCSVTPTAFVIEAGQWQIQTWGGGGAGPWSDPLAFNAPSLTGTWTGTVTSYVRGTFAFGLMITQDGSSLSGVLYDSEVGDIPFAGNIVKNSANLAFSYVYQGYNVTGTLNLTLTVFDGVAMSGNYVLTECVFGTCASDSGTFSLTKQ